jgi:hypothetical protein
MNDIENSSVEVSSDKSSITVTTPVPSTVQIFTESQINQNIAIWRTNLSVANQNVINATEKLAYYQSLSANFK